jgi:RNA polymerase sigma factor (sigma-70 family)
VERSDEELLAAPGSHEFALFYRRHATAVLGYFARRVRDPEAAADLTAETFAAAALARERFRPERGAAVAWLYGIAAHKLADFRRRGRLEMRARRQLGMVSRELTAEDAVEIEALGRELAASILSILPAEQREAIDGHVLADESYETLALRAGLSPSAVRHRVSRGLRTLRRRLEAEGSGASSSSSAIWSRRSIAASRPAAHGGVAASASSALQPHSGGGDRGRRLRPGDGGTAAPCWPRAGRRRGAGDPARSSSSDRYRPAYAAALGRHGHARGRNHLARAGPRAWRNRGSDLPRFGPSGAVGLLLDASNAPARRPSQLALRVDDGAGHADRLRRQHDLSPPARPVGLGRPRARVARNRRAAPIRRPNHRHRRRDEDLRRRRSANHPLRRRAGPERRVLSAAYFSTKYAPLPWPLENQRLVTVFLRV